MKKVAAVVSLACSCVWGVSVTGCGGDSGGDSDSGPTSAGDGDDETSSGSGDGDMSGGDGDMSGGDGDMSGGDGDGTAPDMDEDPDANWTVNWDLDQLGEFGLAVEVATDGSLFVAGSASPYSSNDIGMGLLVKFDGEGAAVWSTLEQTEGQSLSVFNSLALGADGSVFVAGSELADLFGTRDAWIARYDGAGAQQWSVHIAGAAGAVDSAQDIAMLPNGDVAVAGYLNEPVGGRNAWVGVYSGADGSQVWSTTVDGPSSDSDAGTGVAVDPDGNVVLVGVVTAPVTESDEDILVAKYDVGGTLLWSATYDPLVGRDDGANGVAIDSDGVIYVAGYGRGTLASDNYDGVLLALDGADGTQLWQASYDGGASQVDTFLAVAVDDSGGVAVAGRHTPDPYEEVGGINGIVQRYDAATGMMTWSDTHDGPINGFDAANGVDFAANGDIIVTGSVAVSTANGRDDLWLASYTP